MIKQLWQGLGGRDAVSPLAWLIAFPVALVGVTAALAGQVAAPLGQLFLVSLASYCVSAIPYLIAYLSYLNPRSQRPSRPILALLTHLIAQGSAALVLLVFLIQLEAEWIVASGRLTIGMFWALVMSIILQSRAQFQRTSRELIEAIRQARDSVESYDAKIVQARVKLVDKVRTLLAQMLSLRSADQLPEASKAIRPILETIRNSDALPQAPDLDNLRVPALRVVGTAVTAPQAPFAVALAAIAVGPLATLQNLTLPLALNYLPLGLTIFVSLWLVGKYSNSKLVVALVYAIAVSCSLVTATIIGVLFSAPSESLYLVNLRTWLVTFAMGVLLGYYFEQARLIETLENSRQQLEWQVARGRQLLWAETFKLALSVHGDVQSRIISSIANSSELSAVDLERLKAECLQALDRGLSKEFSEFWDQTIRLWKGAAELRLELTPEAESVLRADPVANAASIEIVREAVLNAVRHGRAKNIAVVIYTKDSQADSILTIEVSNDGDALREDSDSGFGSEVISQATTSWMIENFENGVLLSACVPYQDNHEGNSKLEPLEIKSLQAQPAS